MCTFVEKSEDTWEFEMFIKEHTKLNKIFILKCITNNYKDVSTAQTFIYLHVCVYICVHIYTHTIYIHTQVFKLCFIFHLFI